MSRPRLINPNHEQVAAAYTDYLRGDVPVNTVAQRHGFATGTMYQLFKEHGMPIRKKLTRRCKRAARAKAARTPIHRKEHNCI